MTGCVWTRPWCYVWNVLMMSLCLQFSIDSEQYLVAWDRKGMPKDIDRLNNLTVLFTVSVLLECGRFVRKSMCPNPFRLAFESRLLFSALGGWNKGQKRRLLSQATFRSDLNWLFQWLAFLNGNSQVYWSRPPSWKTKKKGLREEGRGGEEKCPIFPPLPLLYFRSINLSLEVSFWLAPTLR